MTSIYRGGDRFDESKTTVSTHTRRNDDGGYTKVTRYVIKDDEDDTRSNYSGRTRRNDNRGGETTTRMSRREVEEPAPQPRREEPRYVERDIVIRTRDESPRSAAPQKYSWERRDEGDRELIIRRTVERDDEPKREERREERELVVSKVEERDDEPRQDYQVGPSRGQFFDRDLQHYSRTAEYYGPPQQPQTIIIRQDPIIIRERVRDDDYQMVRKSDVDERSQVSRKTAPRDDRDNRGEDFFYEKRVRERIDPREQYDDRRSRREVSPGDSISQAGRRRDRSYSSDDSMVYVRRVREGYDSRSPSPDRKKNLAAGVIAGVGAAELLRNHHKKEGKDTSTGLGRLGRDVGAGAIGALAAEGIQRARSQYRERSRRRDSRSRSSSGDRYSRGGRSRSRGRYRSRSRSRSESQSHSKLKTLGALGLGAVAVAAAATIASRKMKENKEAPKDNRRSGSRQRRGSDSVESLQSLENDSEADDARNPKHRNSRIAAAGAVGAAGAALIERARSKSRARSGERERSQSRVRQALPVVAAGLGTAALAGLYEKNKAKREAEKIQEEQKKDSRARSRTRNDSRGKSEGYYNDAANRSGTTLNDPGLIEYGYGPMAGNNFGPGYYGQPPPQEPYSNAVVPAERSARSRSRSMSRDRRGRRSVSVSSESDAGRQNRRRSRDGLSNEAAAAVGAGAAVGENERRKADKKDRKGRKREQERAQSRNQGRDAYEDGYYQPPDQSQYAPPQSSDPYGSQQGFYNQSQFPPPPGSTPHQFQSATAGPQPAGMGYQSSYQPQQNIYQPPNAYGQPDTYPSQNYYPPAQHQPQNYDPYASGANPHAQPRNRGAEDNVSAGHPPSNSFLGDQHQTVHDGVTLPRSINRPPSINIEQANEYSSAPTTSATVPNLTVPSIYTPQDHLPESPAHEETRHVQFASSPEISRIAPVTRDSTDTETMSPDAVRRRRRHNETNRGYEASDDTDTLPEEDPRSRAYDTTTSSHRRERDERDRASGDREREQPRERDVPKDKDRTRDQDNRRASRSQRERQLRDPQESDATIELEPRFDERGRRRGDSNGDPSGSKLDDIRAGKGATGKLLGNFMEGLLGPEGRAGNSTGKEKRRRVSRDQD